MIIVGIIVSIPVIFIIGVFIYNKIWTFKFYKNIEKKREEDRLKQEEEHEEKLKHIKIDNSCDYEPIRLNGNELSIPTKRHLP